MLIFPSMYPITGSVVSLSIIKPILWKCINCRRLQPCSLSWRTWPWRRWRTRWSSSSSPRPIQTQSSKSAQMCRSSFTRHETKKWRRKNLCTNSQHHKLKKNLCTNPQHLESGLMEVISPPSEFYPDLAGLRKTLGKERAITVNDDWDTVTHHARGWYGESDLAFQNKFLNDQA